MLGVRADCVDRSAFPELKKYCGAFKPSRQLAVHPQLSQHTSTFRLRTLRLCFCGSVQEPEPAKVSQAKWIPFESYPKIETIKKLQGNLTALLWLS